MKSWNEIRKAAMAFSRRWKDAYDEKSQAQSFLKEFFELFGVDVVIQKDPFARSQSPDYGYKSRSGIFGACRIW